MLKIKRNIRVGVSAAIIASVLPCVPAVADSAAETQFFEDFESYSITEHYDSSESSALINNAAPQDGIYDESVYPYGTASVYEGNAANNDSVTVRDYAGNEITGGLDGWWGYLSGSSKEYNRWNRRLSVFKLSPEGASPNEINNTQFLRLEPKGTQFQRLGNAYFERQNVDLDGYSCISTRISISSVTGDIYKAGLAIVMNPKDENTTTADLLTFTKSDVGAIDVNFCGVKRAEIPLSAFNDGNALDWYTVECRIYKNSDRARCSLFMVNDRTKVVVANVDWTDMALSGTGFKWSAARKYGIRYYVNAKYQEGQTRLLLDEIKFTKENFTEDFSGFNTKYKLSEIPNITSDISKRIVNAPGGNRNLSEYADGAYEGALQKNNVMFKTMANGTVEKTYGNVPFWQGYMSNPKNAPMIDNQWNMRCNIIPTDDLGVAPYYGKTNVIYLSPKTGAEDANLQTAYVGMEKADFVAGTVWTTKMLLPDVGNADKGTVRLQLTKGYSLTAANGSDECYDGNSHEAYFDVLEIDTKDGSVKFAGQSIADLQLKQNVKYDVMYTVDRTKDSPVHSVIIKESDTGSTIAQTPEKQITNASFFEGNVVGFRYTVTANNGQNAKMVIREVKLDKFFDDSIAGVPDRISLNINESNVIRNVPKELYGVNFEWGGQHGIYMTADNTDFNPSYIEAHRGIVPIARAAGISSQIIDWKGAVGDYSQRTKQKFWHFDPSIIYYGPVEWINSVKTMMNGDAKFIYAINLPKPDGSGDSIEDIKDLVRFMTLMPDDPKAIGSDGVNWAQKRIDCGIAEPVDIYAWELGNELDNEFQGIGGYTVDQYINMCKPVIAAINEIQPQAKISMHVQTIKSNGWSNWHQQILDAVGDDIDYLSEHIYYDPAMDNDYNTINGIISDIESAGYKDMIQVIVTEHGAVNTESSGDSFGFRLPHTMEGVLSTSDFYTTMISKKEIAAANYHSIYSSSWATCWIDDDATVHRTASADLLEIYNQYGVGNAVECSISGFNTGEKTQIDVAAIKTDVGINLIVTNANSVPTTLDLGSTYTVNSSAKLYADSQKADKFEGYDEITYLKDETPKASVSSVELPANSVIALELSTAPQSTSVEITSSDLVAGNTEYKLSVAAESCTVVSAAYDANGVLLNAKVESIPKGMYVRSVANTARTKKIKIMVLENLGNLKPLCECDWTE